MLPSRPGKYSAPSSFADLPVQVPEVLHTIIKSQSIDIRKLRTVSKDVGMAALAAVAHCTVHLGEGGKGPNPSQLVKLLAGSMPRTMTLTVTVTSDERTFTCTSTNSTYVYHILDDPDNY